MSNLPAYNTQAASLPAFTKEGVVSRLPTTYRNRELYRLNASRWVDFFPDALVIQEKTISVIRRYFLVSFVETIPVKDIGRVVYINTPIFAGLRVIGKNAAHQLYIKGLSKQEAAYAKEIIEGLLLEDKGVLDIPTWLETEERRDMLADAAQNLPSHKHEQLFQTKSKTH